MREADLPPHFGEFTSKPQETAHITVTARQGWVTCHLGRRKETAHPMGHPVIGDTGMQVKGQEHPPGVHQRPTPQQREMHTAGLHPRKPQETAKVSPRWQDLGKQNDSTVLRSGGEGGQCAGENMLDSGGANRPDTCQFPVFSEKKGHEESLSPRCPKSTPGESMLCGQTRGQVIPRVLLGEPCVWEASLTQGAWR